MATLRRAPLVVVLNGVLIYIIIIVIIYIIITKRKAIKSLITLIIISLKLISLR